MPENRRKRPRDPAQLAKLMIDIAADEVQDREPATKVNRVAKKPVERSHGASVKK